MACWGIIFADKARAEVAWEDQENSENGTLCKVRFHVAEQAAPIRAGMGRKQIILGHHGQIFFGCGTGVVTRVESESDKDPDKGVELRVLVSFAPAPIGDKQFQLPESAEDFTRFGKELARASATFRNYRKYDASSAIRFGTEEPPR